MAIMIEVASAHSRTQPQFDILRQVGKGIVQKFVTAKHVSEFTVRDLRSIPGRNRSAGLQSKVIELGKS